MSNKTTIFVKATDTYEKGTKPNRMYLDRDSVSKAIESGAKEGDRVTVKVRVGKRRKLVRAYLVGQRDTCCDEHARGAPYYFLAER